MRSLLYAVLRGHWITVIAFVVTFGGFSLPDRGAALLGVTLFVTDLIIRARRPCGLLIVRPELPEVRRPPKSQRA